MTYESKKFHEKNVSEDLGANELNTSSGKPVRFCNTNKMCLKIQNNLLTCKACSLEKCGWLGWTLFCEKCQ